MSDVSLGFGTLVWAGHKSSRMLTTVRAGGPLIARGGFKGAPRAMCWRAARVMLWEGNNVQKHLYVTIMFVQRNPLPRRGGTTPPSHCQMYCQCTTQAVARIWLHIGTNA